MKESLRKCASTRCRRAVLTSVSYCCDQCQINNGLADDGADKVPVIHSVACESRHARRGEFVRVV